MSIEILNDSCLFSIFREIDDKQTLINCSKINRRWHSIIFPDKLPEKRFNLGTIKGSKDVKQKTILDDGEIVAARNELEPDFLPQFGNKIRQLYIPNMRLDDFKNYVKYLPRLERLHLSCSINFSEPNQRYDGPKLERLGILEICTGSDNCEPYRGLGLMDRCPLLKSAFHYIDGEDFFVDTQVKNYNLEDLVIENMFSSTAINWRTLKKILGKCPNLKHLAIRHDNDTDIEDENIPEILELLPKVVLIDLRVSPGVTQISADYVDEYCKLHNRSISFYYEKGENPKADWPYLSDEDAQSCPGYSFMVHCFLKPFNKLPKIMDPIFLLPLQKEKIYNKNKIFQRLVTKRAAMKHVIEDDLEFGNLFD